MSMGDDYTLPRWTNHGGSGSMSFQPSLSRSSSLRQDGGYGYAPQTPTHLDPYSPPAAGGYGQPPRFSHSRNQSLNTPMGGPEWTHGPHSSPPSPLYPQSPYEQVPMALDMPQKTQRESGFRRVRNAANDLQPNPLAPRYLGRPNSAGDGWLNPLALLTTHLIHTYTRCNPAFHYESTHNPRRVLTKPSKPSHNEGYDNEDYDYILYVNDWLGVEDGHKYLILDILGQGTFGQVVKCQNMKTGEVVAVKVVKNKPAYFNQSMMEVTILDLLNKTADPNDTHHILRLRDSFIHRSHLCLVFELLSSNLYELIKQNQFQGLSTQLVKVFMAQLLDALTILKEQRLIHCDLKPENILLKSLQSPQIKVIDFGSACHERQTVYTYIQSRFYRSPEVLLGMSYTASIDMWSLGCIAVELFLGLPLFPGTSEYNQLTRIVDMLGMPPLSMLNQGKQSHQFFDQYEVFNPHLNAAEKKFRLKSLEQYSREHGTNEQPGKQYFKARTLPDIVNTAPMPPTSGKSRGQNEAEKELNNRASFIDFCRGLLDLNPVTRWTPQQARLHPFITGEKFTKPFVPDGLRPSPQPSLSPSTSQPSTSPSQDPKRPYGGLVPSQPKGTRAYQDAASYNQHLAQHQAYTAQAQAQNAFPRNPYMSSNSSTGSATGQQPAPPSSQPQTPSGNVASAPPFPQPDSAPMPPNPAHTVTHSQHAPPPPATTTGAAGYGGHRLQHQASTGQLTAYSTSQSHPASLAPHLNPPSIAVASSGSASGGGGNYYPANSSSSRGRSNTIGNNNTMEGVPPALARLQHMNTDVLLGGRNALTPVLNRDDAMREWERRQSGKGGQGGAGGQPMYSNPNLEYLQQQAELAAASGMGMNSWAQLHTPGLPQPGMGPNRYLHQHQPSKLSHAYHPAAQSHMADESPMSIDVNMTPASTAAPRQRDMVMSNVRAAASANPPSSSATAMPMQTAYRSAAPPTSGSTSVQAGLIQTPPQAYNASTAAARGGYPQPTAAQQYAQSVMQGGQPSPSTQQSGPNSPFDSPIDGQGRGRADLYVPMQPEQYQSAFAAQQQQQQQPQRSPQLPPQGAQYSRRGSGMDWNAR